MDPVAKRRNRRSIVRFRLVPAANSARYQRLFRKLSRRYSSPGQRLALAQSFALSGEGCEARWRRLEKRFCRLMHKQQLTHELNARHRKHFLVLDKHVGRTGGCFRGRRRNSTIPAYFRKRILKQRFAEQNDSKKVVGEDQEETVVVDDDYESVSSESSDSVEVSLVEAKEAVQKKHPDIPDPTKFSIFKEEIKEFCAVQEKIQIVLSMLKSRAQELEESADKELEDVKEKEVKKSDDQDEAGKLNSEAQELEQSTDREQGDVKDEKVNKTDDQDEAATVLKVEEHDVDNAELESLNKYYENSDEEESKDQPEKKNVNEDSQEVQEVESKPEIIFVDAEALDDDSKFDQVDAVDSKENIPSKTLQDIKDKSDLLDPTFSTIKLEPIKKEKSVVDSLFSRFNLKLPTSPPKTEPDLVAESDDAFRARLRDRRKITLKPRYVEEDEDAPTKTRPTKIFEKIHKKLNLETENSNSCSSTEFYGFDEGEGIKLDKPSVPGLLPTPIVKKSRPNAPFLAHGTSFEDIKIENRDDLFREEGLMSFGSLPPRMECPRRPDDMVRPRTVAQKRILLQKKNDVRYLMIDNESKIFNELEKRSKNIDAEADFERIMELQNQNIPFTRDTWRALAWLRTEKGRYFFQSLKIDNHSVKLSGCFGNHESRKLGRKQLSTPGTVSRRHVCQCPQYPANVDIDLSAIRPPETDAKVKTDPEEPTTTHEEEKKLLCDGRSRQISTRPGPLSSKFRYDSELLNRTEDGVYLGPLEIFEMPSVQIEVFPRIDRPLDPTVKPYLKMILPFQGITEQWARFAVSTLKTPDRDEADIPSEEKSFSFSLPYVNDQRRLLIRRRRVAPPATSEPPKEPVESLEKFEQEMSEPLTFRKHLDDHSDPVEKDCADVLAELTDAVAISLAGELFISPDPDCDYTKEDKPVDKPISAQDAAKSSESAAKSKRMLREMKRLNATIIETIPEQVAPAVEHEPKPRCNEQYCSRGCICDVFSGKHTSSSSSTSQSHCNRIDCIFGCQCGFEKKRSGSSTTASGGGAATGKDLQKTEIRGEGLAALTSEDVKYLREKATARLAKEERDFTPTVIMTTNSTVLVRNSDTEMRRHKKKPKKYDDYYNENSVKNLLNGIVPEEEEEVVVPEAHPVERVKTSSIVGQPLTLLEKIRHTHVVLNKLHDLDDVEPWCMIHRLYRCYCNGKATSGKPFKFNEESDIVLPTPVVQPPVDPLLQVYEPRRRRLYSFEKTETVEEIRQPFRKRDSSEESYKPWNERRKKKRREEQAILHEPKSPEKKNFSESTSCSTRASIEDLQINDGQTCRRVIPVNRNFYKTRNYYRKERFRRDIEETKRKNPFAEKRLKHLLEQCERTFFEERRKELEEQARRAQVLRAKKERRRQFSEGDLAKVRQRHVSEGDLAREPIKEPIHIDIVGTNAKVQQNILLTPLIDMDKVLIYCGKKKYYVENEAIKNGKIDLMNIARKFRRTVFVIKKVEHAPLAKPITFSYKNETIMLKGRKYRVNEPYEQKPNEHVDFDCESDDQESTPSLVQETGMESEAQKAMVDQVNSDIMHTMQHIREMLRKNTCKLNPPRKGILYLFRWEKFLQSFNEDLVDVWDVNFQNGTNLVILTTENNRKNTPSFKNTKSVRFARKCTFDTKDVSLLTKMILHQVDNAETNKLSLVLFGTDNYWRFCGFIRAESNYLDKGCEVRPTPMSHPRLAPKINRYFESFVANKKRQQVEETRNPTTQPSAPAQKTLTPTTIVPVPVPVPKPIKEEEEPPAPAAPEPLKVPGVKSNIKLMETKIKDFKNIAIPNVGTRRWFMLNVMNDFSDIYIPSWKSCLTYGRITQAIQLANRYKKTVKLTSILLKTCQEDVLPQIYAAPGQGDCIFLGPYSYTQNIDLMLCQNVDGKMFTREEYERNNHIVRTEHTTGSWLYMKPNVTSALTTTAPAAAASPITTLAANSTTTTVNITSLPKESFLKISPESATTIPATSSKDDDCVVIDDDDEPTNSSSTVSEDQQQQPQQQKAEEEEANAESQNNSQLESLIHQLYNDSDDSDDGTPSESSSAISKTTSSSTTVTATSSTELMVAKNQLSQLVEQTIAESRQLQIKPATSNSAISCRRMSYVPPPTVCTAFATPTTTTIAGRKQVAIPHRRMSYIPSAATTTVTPPSQQALIVRSLESMQNFSLLKRKSTGTSESEDKPSAVQEVKKSRLSLPVAEPTPPVTDEVVCLDDEDDEDDAGKGSAKETSPAAAVPKAKQPSSTTILNSQQAALIASKINLLNPNQKGVVYNPSTGVLRIKRSLMNSLTDGTSVTIPTTATSPSNSKSPPNSALSTKATPPAPSPPSQPAQSSTPKVPLIVIPANKAAPSTVITPPATPRQQQIQQQLPSARIETPKVPTPGVLRSNIPGLGLVPVLWSAKDIIIKVRELSVKQQWVRLANFEAAIVLLNRFIRKNTYTFKPYTLTVGWKFEATTNPLPDAQNLINTINLRCVVTSDGIIDLYKASAIVAFQNTKPNFYEELLLLRLSILCCRKEQYEQEKCHKYFENIFTKATESIKQLQSASAALTTQSNFLREQQQERNAYLNQLRTELGLQSQRTIQMVSKRVAVPQSILDRVSKSSKTPATTTATTTTTTSVATVSSPATGTGGESGSVTATTSQPEKASVIVLDDD